MRTYKIIVTDEHIELDKTWICPKQTFSPLSEGELQDLAASVAAKALNGENGTKIVTIDFTKENCIVVTNE